LRIKVKLLLEELAKRIGMIVKIKLIRNLYLYFRKPDPASVYDEKRVPGRMYSFIANKPQ